eukprot:1160744-Pelagomonas_calceolata.AAC.10
MHAPSCTIIPHHAGPMNSEIAEFMLSCNPRGPLVMHIAKLFPKQDCSSFDAYGRIISGTLRPGDQVICLRESTFTDVISMIIFHALHLMRMRASSVADPGVCHVTKAPGTMVSILMLLVGVCHVTKIPGTLIWALMLLDVVGECCFLGRVLDGLVCVVSSKCLLAKAWKGASCGPAWLSCE